LPSRKAVTDSTATAEAGYRPPSNSGTSATLEGADSTASMISRPEGAVL
jgi:hypothetical protein